MENARKNWDELYGNITPTYVESEITVSQTKLDKRLCEDWSIPAGY